MPKSRPPLKACPQCGLAMQASRSNPDVRQYDTFSCLRCDLVMTFQPRGTAKDEPR